MPRKRPPSRVLVCSLRCNAQMAESISALPLLSRHPCEGQGAIYGDIILTSGFASRVTSLRQSDQRSIPMSDERARLNGSFGITASRRSRQRRHFRRRMTGITGWKHPVGASPAMPRCREKKGRRRGKKKNRKNRRNHWSSQCAFIVSAIFA